MNKKALYLIALSTVSFGVLAQEGTVETNSYVTFQTTSPTFLDSSQTKTDNATGVVGQLIKIRTFHSFYVMNDSKGTKNYLVAETCKVNGKEYKKGWGFSLSAGQYKKFSENAFLDYQATEPGSWKIESMTSVANSGAVSFDHATLTVN